MSSMDGTTAVVEAPVTLKAYLMCAFASFGGIFFGYDSGYINGESPVARVYRFASIRNADIVPLTVYAHPS